MVGLMLIALVAVVLRHLIRDKVYFYAQVGIVTFCLGAQIVYENRAFLLA